MTLIESIQIALWQIAIAVYWWMLLMITLLAIRRYLGDRNLGKIDSKVTPLRTGGIY